MSNPVGRPRADIDFKEMDKLLAIQCTLDEIASWFKVSEDTIQNRVKEEKGVSFSVYSAKGKATGKISLRRSQFQLAKKNATMGIWLGKQYLGQRDHFDDSDDDDIPEMSVTIDEVDASKPDVESASE